jgi:hypothetical protein
VTQTIRRAARRHRFVIVDQAAVEDARLSWAARGLLAYLLSRPDDWKVPVNDLKKRGNLGRDGIYALLRELRSAGYVCFERHRDAQGRMRGGTYIVSEVPAPVPASPDAAEPDKTAPPTVQPGTLQKTDRDPRTTTTHKPTDTNRGTNVNRHRQPLQFPEWVPHEILASAQHLVAGLDHADAQLVIDEWAGALAAGVIQRSPLGYLKTLATRYRAGDMSVRYAIEPLL